MADTEQQIAWANAHIGAVRYVVEIQTGHHRLVADEHPSLGGKDAGPTPFGLLVSALGACTSATLKMYAERKSWPLDSLDVRLRYLKSEDGDHIERVLIPHGPLDAAQRARLADIAERTPVTLAIRGGVAIRTRLEETAA
ncbi:OsmC family protein [Sphingosinicella sp. LHD-64]|uniref:OsmC family protein n=1 Tax=Sphingosinicella sp. LHD-64 TaxID=3072139 RepID=UPI00280F3AA7|nr:OsmC family protein [Sphingosinicella sp. LHD-64]MDQ8755321.1 OsmC family protein [Sphingosinicella sp. LHD-64]